MAISNAFVEWSRNSRCAGRSAHLLLQIRTHVLNDDLAEDFRRWYPAFMPMSEPQDLAALNSHALSRSTKPAVASRIEVLEDWMVGHQRNARAISPMHALFVLTTRIPCASFAPLFQVGRAVASRA
jgi:hypothetical protein